MIAALLFATACHAEVIAPVTGRRREAFVRWAEAHVDDFEPRSELRIADIDNDGVDDYVVTSYQGSGGYLALAVFHRTAGGWRAAKNNPFDVSAHDYFDPITGKRTVLVRFCGRVFVTLLGGPAPHYSRDAWVWQHGKAHVVCDAPWIAEQRRAFRRLFDAKRYDDARGFLEGVASACGGNGLQRDLALVTRKIEESASTDFTWLIGQHHAVRDPRFGPLLSAIVPEAKIDDERLRDVLEQNLYLSPEPRLVDGRYIVLDGCRPHDCSEKGFLWIDTREKTSVVAVSGVVASRSFGPSQIPAAAWRELLDAVPFAPDERVTFIGRDGASREIDLPTVH